MTDDELTPEDSKIMQEAVDSLRRSLVTRRLHETSTEVQEALEDLWSNIGSAETRQLQPETIEIAKQNHQNVSHKRRRP